MATRDKRRRQGPTPKVTNPPKPGPRPSVKPSRGGNQSNPGGPSFGSEGNAPAPVPFSVTRGDRPQSGDSKAAEKAYWDDVFNAQGMGWAAPTNPGYGSSPPSWYLALGDGRPSPTGYQRQTPYGWLSDNEYRQAVATGQIQGPLDQYGQADPYGTLWGNAGGGAPGGGPGGGGAGAPGTGPGGGMGSGSGGTGSGGSAGGGAPGAPSMDGLDKYDRDAAEAIINLFKTYGLDSLAPTVVDMIRRGMGEAAIVASLRETKEYKDRFPGMEALRQQGYNAITEAQYLQLEDSYHQALQGAGMPKGFYDEPTDFVKFISNGVDPGELKQRATAAVDLVAQVDPAQRELLASMYGVGNGDIAAYFLDPKKAMPLLQRQLSAVQIGSAARHAGVQADFANRGRFERLVDNGIGVDEAKQGYTQIASEMDPLKNLASIWGQGSWSLNEAEDAQFFGDAGARKKRARMVNTERAAFSGASGFDSRVSGRGSSAGSF